MDNKDFEKSIGFIGSIATVATAIVLACMGKTEGVVVTIVIGAIVFPLLLWYWLEKKIDGKIRSLIAETEFSQLNADVAELNKTKSEFDQRLDACAVFSKTATDKADELKNEITELHSEITGLNQRLDACDASVEGIRASLEEEKAVFKEEKTELVRKVDACVSSANAATDKTDALKKEITVLHGEIAGFAQKVNDCSEKNAKLEEKVQKLAEALEKLNTAVRSVEDFIKWDDAKVGDRQVLTINEVEFAFRYCPPGNFMMGSPDDEKGRFDNETFHRVNISEGYWICEVPTTQEQWDAVGVKKEIECEFKGAKLPVENVTWYESDAFIKKLNELGVAPNGWRFVLPTEEQWEYACRAGTTGSTYGVPLDEAAWYYSNSRDKTHEVGTKKPNKWGIFDMLGNVWEWTSSKYNGGSSFVRRGGSWFDIAQYCRPANRYYYSPASVRSNLGARAALVRQSSK